MIVTALGSSWAIRAGPFGRIAEGSVWLGIGTWNRCKARAGRGGRQRAADARRGMTSAEEFRRVMGHFATGVTVVTSRGPEGEPVGLTVNAFTSVSLEPLLVLVCIHNRASGREPLLGAGHFAVNILAEDQEALALRFASKYAAERFHELEIREGSLGSPVVPGALAWLECRVHAVFPGGDHSVILGEVVDYHARRGRPLLFFQGRLRGLGE